MPSPIPFIERTWFAIAPDGTEQDVAVRVEAPVQDPRGEWRALVSVGCLESRIHSIAGIDSWQAMGLAMNFAANRVCHFSENGWKFYWERGGDIASLADLANVS